MPVRTRRGDRGARRRTFPVTSTERQVEKFIRAGTPEYIAMTTIRSFDWVDSPYVEDGDGSRYNVIMEDGSKHEVEFYDYFSPSSDFDEESRDAEDRYDQTVEVIWDGAVDFSEYYNANDDASIMDMKRSLKNRYGALAADFLGER